MMMLMLPMVPVSWKGGIMRVCFMLYFMGSVMVPDIILSYLCRGSQKFPFTPKIVKVPTTLVYVRTSVNRFAPAPPSGTTPRAQGMEGMSSGGKI